MIWLLATMVTVAGTQQSLHTKSCNDRIQIWMDKHSSCYAQYICEVQNFPDASPSVPCIVDESPQWTGICQLIPPSWLSRCAWVDTYEGTSLVQTITANSQTRENIETCTRKNSFINIDTLTCTSIGSFQNGIIQLKYCITTCSSVLWPLAVVNQGHYSSLSPVCTQYTYVDYTECTICIFSCYKH